MNWPTLRGSSGVIHRGSRYPTTFRVSREQLLDLLVAMQETNCNCAEIKINGLWAGPLRFSALWMLKWFSCQLPSYQLFALVHVRVHVYMDNFMQGSSLFGAEK